MSLLLLWWWHSHNPPVFFFQLFFYICPWFDVLFIYKFISFHAYFIPFRVSLMGKLYTIKLEINDEGNHFISFSCPSTKKNCLAVCPRVKWLLISFLFLHTMMSSRSMHSFSQQDRFYFYTKMCFRVQLQLYYLNIFFSLIGVEDKLHHCFFSRSFTKFHTLSND